MPVCSNAISGHFSYRVGTIPLNLKIIDRTDCVYTYHDLNYEI